LPVQSAIGDDVGISCCPLAGENVTEQGTHSIEQLDVNESSRARSHSASTEYRQ